MKYCAIATIGKDYLLSNYGSFFQHYALRQVLKRLGFAPFRVRPKDEHCSRLLILWDRIKDGARPYYWLVKGLAERERKAKHLRFRNKVSKGFLCDYRVLIGSFDERMVFDEHTYGIRGGDQVICVDSDKAWLEDIKQPNPRIIYAASTDWSLFSANRVIQSNIVQRLSGFTAIGLRESRGVELLSGLLAQKIEKVVDPVMLLWREDFTGIESRRTIFTQPTLFCYLVNIRSEEDLQVKKYRHVAEMLGCDLKILGIQGAEEYAPKQFSINLRPVQFLRAINEARYFITNSYHGSVFGLIYNKRFLSVWQNCPVGTDQNERQRDLMEQYGLERRWVDYRLSDDQILDAILTEEDWASINSQIEKDRQKSLEWLKGALSM